LLNDNKEVETRRKLESFIYISKIIFDKTAKITSKAYTELQILTMLINNA